MEIDLHPLMRKIKISSQAKNIRLVEKLVDEVCDKIGIHEEKYGNILIALTEAVNNAMHHGNDLDPNKNTSIQCGQENEKLKFIVQDEGLGFDFNNIPDPTDPNNLQKTEGRGVFLMKHLSDELSFEENGSRVELIFDLSTN